MVIMWLLLSILSTLAATIVFYFCHKFKNAKKYWKQQHVATMQSSHFICGDIKNVLIGRENLAAAVNRAYRTFKQLKLKYGGLYIMSRPVFLPIDPQLIRNIIVKDFHHFVNRGIHSDKVKDPLGAHMFNLNDVEWRPLRQKLSSSFTTRKLKNMIDALQLHADKLNHTIANILDTKDLILNEYFEQIGIDIIANVAFGLNCNTLGNNQDETFLKMTNRIFHPKLINLLKFLLFDDCTNPGNIIKLATSDTEMTQFFLKLIRDTVQHRKHNISDDNAASKDFLQLLFQMHLEDDLSVEQIAAQTFFFFIAAFETSSKALNFAMYELSKNKPLQDELRREVRANVKRFTYEELMENKLLDIVVKETLRKHPSVVYLHRQCNKPYRVSSETVLDKGVLMLIPVYAIHHDPEYFPNPEVYDPMRFDGDEGSKLGKVDPSTYFPFGDGPRNCIGMRFALLQVKLIIAKLLSQFAFTPSAMTIEPLEFKPVTENLLLNYKHAIHFNVEKL